MKLPDHIIEEAISWHIRLVDDAADWEGFATWLEADPVHARAYDAIASADRAIDEHRAALPAEHAMRGRRITAPRWAPWGMAAALLLTLGLGARFWSADSAPERVYETGASVRRIALAEGTEIVLDRHSAVAVRPGTVNEVTLKRGGAYFIAPPDPEPSFDVRVGRYHVRDIGTRFFVGQAHGRVQVQVAAGAIVLAAAAQNGLQLKPGQGIEIAEKSDQARLYKIQPNHVAGWQIGQLTYDDVPISVVVGDLQRASGLTLALDPRIADQRFTGVLTIGDGARLVSDFSHLTGFVAEKRGQAIIFLPQH